MLSTLKPTLHKPPFLKYLVLLNFIFTPRRLMNAIKMQYKILDYIYFFSILRGSKYRDSDSEGQLGSWEKYFNVLCLILKLNNNSIYLTSLLWEFIELICIKCSELCTMHHKDSYNVISNRSQVMDLNYKPC